MALTDRKALATQTCRIVDGGVSPAMDKIENKSCYQKGPQELDQMDTFENYARLVDRALIALCSSRAENSKGATKLFFFFLLYPQRSNWKVP